MKRNSFKKYFALLGVFFLLINAKTYGQNTVDPASVSVDSSQGNQSTRVMKTQAVPPSPTLIVESTTQTNVNLSWNAVSGATSYTVCQDGTPIPVPIAGTTSSPAVSCGTTHNYSVRANNAGGYSTSNTVSGTAIPCNPTLTVASTTQTNINLSWNAVSGATGYTVCQDGTPIPVPIAGTTSSPAVSCGTTHNYSVRASNAGGYSTSNTVSGTAAACTSTMYILAVTAANGTVVKNPDQPNYISGTQVLLTPQPAAGYAFANWSGDASGTTNPLTVTMNGNKNITANFTVTVISPTISLSTTSLSVGYTNGTTSFTISNSGGSTLNWRDTSNVSWITVSPKSGTNSGTVTVTYTANTGSTARTGKITVSATGATNTSQTVTVTQAGAPKISLSTTSLSVGYTNGTTSFTISNSGGSTLNWRDTSNVSWITVSPKSGTNSGTVTVTYTANTGSTARTGKITVSATGATNTPQTVTVTQAGVPRYTLTVNATSGGSATGSGTVTYGVPKAITASPNSGYQFANWTVTSGTASIANPNSANTTVTLTSGNATVTANFAIIIQYYTLTVTAANGTVLKNPDQASYQSGTTVQLTATANAGYTFTGWSGDASGTTNPLTVTMNGNKNITANFTKLTEFYVSPSGNDITGNGLITNPYKTLDTARSVIQRYITANGMSADIYVYLRGGTYNLPSTLNFVGADGGKGIYKIIYKSYPGEHAVISGGISVQSNLWVNNGNNIFKANLTQYGLVNIRQLYVDSLRWIRARYNLDTSFHVVTTTTIKSLFSSFPTVQKPSDVEVVAKWGWMWAIKKVKSYSSNTCTFDTLHSFFLNPDAVVPYLENDLSFLTNPGTPGQWYYNKDTKDLYVKTYNSSPPSNVVVPVLDKIISGNGVSNLMFDSLTFSYGTWSFMFNKDFNPNQACGYMAGSVNFIPGNVDFKSSSNITFNNNTFTHLGGIGLCVENGSSNCTIQNNQFYDISAEAIRIGEPLGPSSDNTQKVSINKNSIHDVAVEYRGSAGIFLGFVDAVSVSSNVIYNLPYTGISMGYQWDITHTYLSEDTIQGNEIYKVLTELNDGAAIYNLGQHASRSFIQNNYIHDIQPDVNKKIRAGIYLDQGSNNITVKDNHGSEFPYYIENNKERNTDIFMNYKNNIEAQQNVFGTNNFGKNSFWIRKLTTDNNAHEDGFTPTCPIDSQSWGDMGVNIVDVDGNWRKDMVYYRKFSNGSKIKKVYINEIDHWVDSSNNNYFLPDSCPTWIEGKKDAGARFVDFDGDSLDDLLYYRWVSASEIHRFAYRNNGNGWTLMPNYCPPYHFSADGYGDLGARFVNVMGDNKKDIVFNRDLGNGTFQRGVYWNNGNGWTLDTSSAFVPPIIMYKDGIGDLGVRFVDIDGDGREDLLQYRWISPDTIYRNAYYNRSSGWIKAPDSYLPPYPFSADYCGDLGARFVDVDWNGKKDIVYNRDLGNGTFQKGVYLNKESGWELSTDSMYIPPVALYKDGVGSQGVRFVDLNGDGHEDIIKGYKEGSGNLITDFYLNKARMFYTTLPPPMARIGSKISISSQNPNEVPEKYSLSQNYPNPFNPTSTIKYQLPKDGLVTLKVYDILGREVAELVNEMKQAGYYQVDFNASRLASGIYFYRISMNGFVQTKKMMLIK